MNALPKGFQAAARQYESASPPEDDYLADEILDGYLSDPEKLADAAEHVMGFTDWPDHAARDVAACMTGHPDDQDARDLRFMRELRGKVRARLEEMAQEAAESERLQAEEARGEPERLRRYA